jgi:hypothetical protein
MVKHTLVAWDKPHTVVSDERLKRCRRGESVVVASSIEIAGQRQIRLDITAGAMGVEQDLHALTPLSLVVLPVGLPMPGLHAESASGRGEPP